MQALTCGQLANTYQEDANALTSWYSGWYNGLAHKHYADFKKGREVEHQRFRRSQFTGRHAAWSPMTADTQHEDLRGASLKIGPSTRRAEVDGQDQEFLDFVRGALLQFRLRGGLGLGCHDGLS